MRMRIVAALVGLSPLWAQGVSIGLRAGIPISSMLTGNGNERTSEARFTIGPFIDGHLWQRWLWGRFSTTARGANGPNAGIPARPSVEMGNSADAHLSVQSSDTTDLAHWRFVQPSVRHQWRNGMRAGSFR